MSGNPRDDPALAPFGAGALVPMYVLAILAAFGPIAIDMHLPSLPSLQSALATSPELIQLTLGAFVICFAAGQLVLGPLSDTIGRRPVLLGGVGVFVLASAICALADSVQVLILGRVLQGLGACVGAVVGRAIVRDAYPGNAGARLLSVIMTTMAFAPLVAPTLGGWLLVAFGWRAIFWAMLAFSALTLVLVFVRAPETHPAHARISLHPWSVVRGYWKVLVEPQAFGCIAGGGLLFAGVFAYIAGVPFVYIDHFGVPAEFFGLLFGLNAFGLLLGAAMTNRLVARLGWRRVLRVAGWLGAASALALLGVALTRWGGLVAVAAPLFTFVASLGMLGPTATTGALENHPQRAGAASALAGSARFGLGAGAIAALAQLHDGTPLAMAVVMFACGATGLALLSWLVPGEEPLAADEPA